MAKKDKKKEKKKDKKTANTTSGAQTAFPMGVAFAWFYSEDAKKIQKAQAKKFMSAFVSFLEKSLVMRKSMEENRKDRVAQQIDFIMDVQDDFIDSLPEEAPSIPGMKECPVSPKDLMKSIQEFEKIANEHIVEQADARADFSIQRQEKAKNIILQNLSKLSKKDEDKNEADEATTEEESVVEDAAEGEEAEAQPQAEEAAE